MKKNWIGMVVMVLIALVAGEVMGQSAFTSGFDAAKKTFDNGVVISFAGNVDSTDTLTSKEFVISEYDNDLMSYPLQCQVYLAGNAVSTRKVSCYLLGSNYNDADYFVVVDTLLYKDSVATVLYKQLNGNGKVYARWKLKFTGETGNTDTDFECAVYAYRKD